MTTTKRALEEIAETLRVKVTLGQAQYHAILAALREAADAAACRHGWRGSSAEAISDMCPSCGFKSLFIGVGGWLTCANLECKSPATCAEWQAKIDAARQEEREALRKWAENKSAKSELVYLYDIRAWLDARSRGEEPKP